MRQMAPTVESTNTFELSLVVTNLLNEMFGILMFLKKFNFFLMFSDILICYIKNNFKKIKKILFYYVLK
jgi:hypothetical protein